MEISELTAVINQDIDGLKRSLIALESCGRNIPNNGRKDVAKQTKTQIKELSSRVTLASKSFLNVIELRKENIKFQNERRSHFQNSDPLAQGAQGGMSSSSTSSGPDGVRNRRNQTNQAFAAFEQNNSNSVLFQDEMASKQNSVPREAFQGSSYQDMQMMQQEDNYAQEREQNMATIESAIVEVGNVMRQLGNLVAEQQETVMRIDSNVESAELNIEAAHSEILKYFQSVTNNRWLMAKVFGTLVVFFIVFVVFFA